MMYHDGRQFLGKTAKQKTDGFSSGKSSNYRQKFCMSVRQNFLAGKNLNWENFYNKEGRMDSQYEKFFVLQIILFENIKNKVGIKYFACYFKGMNGMNDNKKYFIKE